MVPLIPGALTGYNWYINIGVELGAWENLGVPSPLPGTSPEGYSPLKLPTTLTVDLCKSPEAKKGQKSLKLKVRAVPLTYIIGMTQANLWLTIIYINYNNAGLKGAIQYSHTSSPDT